MLTRLAEACPQFDGNGMPVCLNFDALLKFARESDLIRTMLLPEHVKKSERNLVSGIFSKPDANQRQKNVVLLMLTPMLMNLGEDVYNFTRSQLAAYASDRTAPMFGKDGLEVNVEWCLLAVNFFRLHVKGDLAPCFQNLGATGVPQMWNKKLGSTYPELGRLWNGTYAYLDKKEVMALRGLDGDITALDRHIYIDRHVDEEFPIQVSKFWIPASGRPAVWSDAWEAILQSKGKYAANPIPAPGRRRRHQPQHHVAAPAAPGASATAPQQPPHVMRPRHGTKWILDGTVGFEGVGFDDEDFYASGWLNPLPPQRGVPGWQRLTMMKYFRDPDGAVDHGVLWAYEGVVLPGGQIIVGRWWAPENVDEDHKYSGPIIMWCADQSVSEAYRNVSRFLPASLKTVLMLAVDRRPHGSGAALQRRLRRHRRGRCSRLLVQGLVVCRGSVVPEFCAADGGGHGHRNVRNHD